MSWVAVAGAAMVQLAGEAAAIWTGLGFFLLGLSHGAGDEQDGSLQSFGLVHASAYLLVGAAIAGLFLAAPLAGLVVFFALSAWHFSRSECRFDPVVRFAIAGIAVGGSALFRFDETASVLGYVAGSEVPRNFVRLLALAGLAGVASGVFAFIRGRRGFGHAIVSAIAACLLHPVLAVGLIFLIAHAIPVQERQIATYGARRVLQAVAVPTLLATAGAILLGLSVLFELIAPAVAVALAFGMATPHMLTERLER